jgi:phosphate-selective porin
MKHCYNNCQAILHRENYVSLKLIPMKKIFSILLFAASGIYGYAQVQVDSLQEQVSIQEGKINALDERVLVNEGDLDKLRKIKLSGYIQTQFDHYQEGTDPQNTFYIRRARIKFTYEATDGIKFVLQPDFSTGNLSLKDAYAVVNIPKLQGLTLWAGQFNRPNYEVEYSSSQREVLERSRVIRTIYPGEREIGAKLEYMPNALPLKLQFAVLNGNFTGKEAKDVDKKKDLMARATYSFNFPGAGIGMDLGIHGYYGALISGTNYVSDYEAQIDSTDNNKGSYYDKHWLGGEMQIYFDFLGGMSLKGEYIQGKNATAGDSKTNPFKIRNFSGYYVYLIKNVGKKNQFAARFDYYDPNTKLSGDDAGKEVNYKTLDLAWHYYLNDNIRITMSYELARNETNASVTEDKKDDVFSIRVQAKF